MNLLVFFPILSQKSVSGSRLHGVCMGRSGTSAVAVYALFSHFCYVGGLARGSICSSFIDSVPLIEIVRATSTIEVALSVLLERRKEWEDTFVKKFGVPVDNEVGLPKMIGAFGVMAQCSLDVEGVGFVKSAPPQSSTPELQELKKLVEDQHMAMEGPRKELAKVSAKSQAAARRKMARVPPLCKSELLKICDLDTKPQWVYASLIALSTLLWRREVPAHEYVSRF